jgi:CubicO group peptidase (beta-lactamase class C family)
MSVILISTAIRAQTNYFPPLTGNSWEVIAPESLGYCQIQIDRLYNFLDSNNTKALILLKGGKIVLEKYFGTHTQNTLWQWASAGKTITSFMVGMAQQEGYLSIDDTSSKYLGKGWTACLPEQEDKITIRHQLSMNTGLDDGVPENHCTLDTCLQYKADAGTRWAYHNAPYTLLDSVIENATGMTLNAYTNQKLKNPTGMTGLFVRLGYNNVFFSNARSMARFGILIQNEGNWNGTQVMTDSIYFSNMVNTSQDINPSYGYLWWLNGKASYMIPQVQFSFNGSLCPNAPADMIAAMGKDGQFLNVVPGNDLVWVRMGEAPDGLPVPFLLNDQIWEYLNDLNCAVTKTNNPASASNQFRMFPNPAGELLNIISDQTIVGLEIYSVQGNIINRLDASGMSMSISIGQLPAGFYFIKANLKDGNSRTGKLLKL